MKIKFLSISPVALSVALFLAACGSGGDKKGDEPVTDSTTATTADTSTTAREPAPASKLSNVLMIRHKVANFTKWKASYESHDSIRNSYGLTNYAIGRARDDSNMVLVIMKMADVTKAKELTGSQGMK